MAQRIFVDATYGFRNWRYGLGIVAFGGTGGLMVLSLAKSMAKKTPHGSEWAIAAFFLGIAGFFCWAAAFLLWSAITGRQAIARIDEAGITFDRRFVAWDRVRFIRGVRSGRHGFQLQVGIRRRPDYGFWIGRSWTADEYDALRAELDPFLETAHPTIGLGP